MRVLKLGLSLQVTKRSQNSNVLCNFMGRLKSGHVSKLEGSVETLVVISAGWRGQTGRRVVTVSETHMI